jgi:predicted flavoprotein YhiN
MFAACSAVEAIQQLNTNVSSEEGGSGNCRISVTVLEASNVLMTKVKVSGGGRCNVLHDTTKSTREILNSYPRGQKELAGILSKRFTPKMARRWFESKGVELKTEGDGRMFPTSDDSQTIIHAIQRVADEGGVTIERGIKIKHVEQTSDGTFRVHTSSKDPSKSHEFDTLVLATGSSPTGRDMAQNLGHTVVAPVPSLFTMRLAHETKEGGLLHGLSGLSMKHARVTFKADVKAVKGLEHPATENHQSADTPKAKRSKQKQQLYTQEGPLLITHEGISGPASLKLSAYAAREFHAINYRGMIYLHFAPDIGKVEEVEAILLDQKQCAARKLVSTGCPLVHAETDYENYDAETGAFPTIVTRLIPKRLWGRLCEKAGIASTSRWADVSKKNIRKLADNVVHYPVEVTGKSTNKEEFVTAGGIMLSEIDMTCMQSKVAEGVFYCGECIDVDGITGGFNFMNW